MTTRQLEQRKERAASETYVVLYEDEGFTVYSPSNPTKRYLVTGSPEVPACNCPDFQQHKNDPQWRCNHILAAFDQIKKDDPDAYAAEERKAIQAESQAADKAQRKRTGNRNNGPHSQMLLKRSVSPDGRIDSLSVEFSCPVDKLQVKDIKESAQKTLQIQSEIIQNFLSASCQAIDQPQSPPQPNGAQPAQFLNIGGMNGKWGRRLFINVQVNGHGSKLFGNQKQLAEALTNAGYPQFANSIAEGIQLNVPCRVITKPSDDGKYLNIERVLPLEPPPQGR